MRRRFKSADLRLLNKYKLKISTTLYGVVLTDKKT